MPLEAPEIHAHRQGAELNADEYNKLAVCVLNLVAALNAQEAELAELKEAPAKAAPARKTASK